MTSHSLVRLVAVLALLTLHSAPSQAVTQEEIAVACSDYALEREGRYICTEDGKDITCLAGWANRDSWCQEPVCGTLCKKPNGVCHSPDKCSCEVGFYGDECEYCAPLPGCINGNCNKPFECNCQEGWSGELCDKPICGKDCHNGYCIEPYGKCQCHNGWKGARCDVCIPLPGCDALHGYCLEPMDCKCNATWTGTFCNIPACPDRCEDHGHGTCDNGMCKCEIGWRGEVCDTCVPYPGCDQGTCSEPWECNCHQGWTGYLCNITKEEDRRNQDAAAKSEERVINQDVTNTDLEIRDPMESLNPERSLGDLSTNPSLNTGNTDSSSGILGDEHDYSENNMGTLANDADHNSLNDSLNEYDTNIGMKENGQENIKRVKKKGRKGRKKINKRSRNNGERRRKKKDKIRERNKRSVKNRLLKLFEPVSEATTDFNISTDDTVDNDKEYVHIIEDKIKSNTPKTNAVELDDDESPFISTHENSKENLDKFKSMKGRKKLNSSRWKSVSKKSNKKINSKELNPIPNNGLKNSNSTLNGKFNKLSLMKNQSEAPYIKLNKSAPKNSVKLNGPNETPNIKLKEPRYTINSKLNKSNQTSNDNLNDPGENPNVNLTKHKLSQKLNNYGKPRNSKMNNSSPTPNIKPEKPSKITNVKLNKPGLIFNAKHKPKHKPKRKLHGKKSKNNKGNNES